VFNTLHFTPYFAGTFGFALCGLAGLGVNHLLRERPSAREILLAPAVLIAFGAALIYFAGVHTPNPALSPSALMAAAIRMGAEGARVAVIAAIFIGALVWFRRSGAVGVFGALVVALVCLELLPLHTHPRWGRADVWSQPPQFVRYLQTDPGLYRMHSVSDL